MENAKIAERLDYDKESGQTDSQAVPDGVNTVNMVKNTHRATI